MSASVVVVIVNWNGRQYLEACLSSVMAQSCAPLEVVLVDNGSTDGSQDYVQHAFPQVRLIQLPANVGFAAGNNVAIRQTESEFVATVNNDVILENNWLEAMVAGVSRNAEYGMAASKIILYPGKDKTDSTGIEVDHAGVAWNRHFGIDPHTACPQDSEVFGPSAAAAVYRRKLFADIGLFDEDYFAFYEDVDLAWRAGLRGWRCHYVADAVAFHYHSASAGRNPRLKSFLIARNKAWTILKDYPTRELLVFLPFVLYYEIAPCIFYLFRDADLSRIKGKIAAARGLSGVLAKRKAVQSARTASGEDLRRIMVPLKNPFGMPPSLRQ